MPDGSINVKITADASGFTSGVNQAKGAADQLGAGSQTLRATIEQLRAAMKASVSGTAALRQSLDQAGQAFANATSKVHGARRGASRARGLGHRQFGAAD